MRSPNRARRASPVRQLARSAAVGLIAVGLATPIDAQSGEEDELLRWVPALGFSFDMLQHKTRGAITTGDVLGPPLGQGGCTVTETVRNPTPPPFFILQTRQTGTLCENSPPAITQASSSGDTDVAPLVDASLELAAPRLIDGFFSPRLFAHVDAAVAFGFERTVAGERKPGPFFVDPLTLSHTEYSEGEVGGQGSRAKIQVRPLVVGTGAGVAFTATIFDRTVRLKPSFEYLYQEVDLIASVHRAVKQRDPARSINDFRLIELSADSREKLHALGGGLELEVDASRMGPIGVSVFVFGRGYRFTGNLHHTFHDTNEFNESATWDYELDPWTYRAGVGARFRWIPE
jgi:hypothetical protein